MGVRRKYGWWCLGLLFFCAGPLSYGGELLLGMGYGEQLGERSCQDNGVVDLSYEFYATEPSHLQFVLGAGISWLWTDFRNESLYMVSVLPSLRYYLKETKHFKPYLYLTVGPSYLSEDHLGMQRQGGHFAFSDFIGVGSYVGAERLWSIRWSWRHISNASTREYNEGIDIITHFSVGRQF